MADLEATLFERFRGTDAVLPGAKSVALESPAALGTIAGIEGAVPGAVPASDVCWLVWGRLHEYASEHGHMKALELFNVLDKVG